MRLDERWRLRQPFRVEIQENPGKIGDARSPRKLRTILPIALSTWVAVSPAVGKETRGAFFEDSVLPLLEENCYQCHSHETKIKGGLVLDSRSGWDVGGDSGPAVVAGKPEESLLLKAVSYRDDELRMPPKSRLTKQEVAVFRKWIEDGAFDPRRASRRTSESEKVIDRDLWSLQPLNGKEGERRSIDDFLNDRLIAEGLIANGEADREVLLRRASFGLTGLPSTAQEVSEFLNDDSPGSWQRLIDRLLDSPRYGERWGRHWLDLARYGDSNGADINYAHANAWRYRDYVIAAFNADKPYDAFIREQLAGDLLAAREPGRRAELLTATGFLMLGPKMLAEVDGEKLLIDIVDEQLDVVGKTFLGMTFGCARCHDHKFDPITAKDYYALAGIFRSTKIMDSHRPQKTVGEWVEVDVRPQEKRRLAEALRAERAKLQAELGSFGEEVSTKEGASAAIAHRAVVARNLPELHSTTWAARVRIDTPQNLGGIISADYNGASQGHSLGFDRIRNGQAPRVVWNHNRQSTIITAAEPISLGNWHHVAVTYDADTKRLVLYVDGEPSASSRQVASTPFNKIGVGRREAPQQFQLLGDLDDVVVYDTALTQEEIVLLDSGQTVSHVPVLRWDFDTFKDGRVVDATGKFDGDLVQLDVQSAVVEDGFDGFGLTLGVSRALDEAERGRQAEIRDRLKAIGGDIPPAVMVMAVQAGAAVDLPIHVRGNHTNPSREVVRRTTPEVFLPNLPAIEIETGRSGRLELADWIVHQDNPLTARVMVNRIWKHHFGEGLVRSLSNFGGRGERPSHPELLDWLAREFMENGWSIKHMHRLILASAAYRRSSGPNRAALEADGDNRLLARYPIRRLEAEAIRDSLLAVSGELEVGSPGNLMTSPNMKRVAMTPTDSVYQSRRRGVFLPAVRVRGYEMFSLFDVSDNGQHVADRPETMVAQQALYFLNNPFVKARSEQVARRVLERGWTDRESVAWLYRLMFGRGVAPGESELVVTHLGQLRSGMSEMDAWQSIVHSLFCSNEFIYLR